jgi:hypothetical protein
MLMAKDFQARIYKWGFGEETVARGEEPLRGYTQSFAHNKGVAVPYIQIGADTKGFARTYIQTKSAGLAAA